MKPAEAWVDQALTTLFTSASVQFQRGTAAYAWLVIIFCTLASKDTGGENKIKSKA